MGLDKLLLAFIMVNMHSFIIHVHLQHKFMHSSDESKISSPSLETILNRSNEHRHLFNTLLGIILNRVRFLKKKTFEKRSQFRGDISVILTIRI